MNNSKHDEDLNFHHTNTSKDTNTYHDDVYDEDDFYGQIMRNASRNNPRKQAQEFENQEPVNLDGIKETGSNDDNSLTSKPNQDHKRTSNTQGLLTQPKPLSRRARQKALQESQNTSGVQEPPNLSKEQPKPAMTLIEEVEAQRKSKAKKKSKKRNTKKEKDMNAKQYTSFVKQNLCIFLYATINSALLCLIISYIMYTQVILNYTITQTMQETAWKLSLIVAPIMGYQIAGFHCGLCMLKTKVKKMKFIFKILLAPLLFIIYEVLGLLCEIPYLLYALVKMNKK